MSSSVPAFCIEICWVDKWWKRSRIFGLSRLETNKCSWCMPQFCTISNASRTCSCDLFRGLSSSASKKTYAWRNLQMKRRRYSRWSFDDGPLGAYVSYSRLRSSRPSWSWFANCCNKACIMPVSSCFDTLLKVKKKNAMPMSRSFPRCRKADCIAVEHKTDLPEPANPLSHTTEFPFVSQSENWELQQNSPLSASPRIENFW